MQSTENSAASSNGQAHSPLGASGMERWENCPGSVQLIQQLLPIELEQDDPAYRREGTAAHAIAAKCLTERLEAWEFIGQTIEGVEITSALTNAVQVYLNHCWPIMDGAEAVYIEHGFSNPDVHPLFKGTTDFAALKAGTLYIRDYKHGAGVTVDERGPQPRYYSYAMLLLHPESRRCDIGIVQPNAFHAGGSVRTWTCDADDIHGWANDTLLPAMQRAERDKNLKAGDYCRFCPLKIVCPMLQGLFGAAATTPVRDVNRFTDAQLGQEYKLLTPVRMYSKAVEEEVYRRLQSGRTITGVKLVAKKANRVWKEGADAVFKKTYGDLAYTERELKSPAQMAEIGPLATDLVKEWAYTPQTGTTVALDSDNRPAINVKTMAETFANVKGDET